MQRPNLLISLLFLLLVATLLFPPALSAKDPRKEYRNLQKELRLQQKKLKSAEKAELTTVSELKKTKEKLQEVKADLASRKKKIQNVKDRISSQEAAIRRVLEALKAEKGLLRDRMRAIHRAGKVSDTLLIIVSGADLSRALRMQRYLTDISAYDTGIITRHKKTIEELNEKQAELKQFYGELRNEERGLALTESSLEKLRQKSENKLVDVRKEKTSYTRMIQELKDASGRLQRIIEESERRERELRKKQRADKKELPEESEFTRLKGRLWWPVSGSLAIPYGSQNDTLFNLPVFRSGIHIRTEKGAPVKAVYDGKVVYADSFKGYGQLVIINHGNGYHTLYGNLSRIFCKNGVIIKNRQVIGEAGESTALGTNGLYFEVRYKGKPLDPQQWLKTR